MPQKHQVHSDMPPNVLIFQEARAAAARRRGQRRFRRGFPATAMPEPWRNGYLPLNTVVSRVLFLCGLAGAMGMGVVVGLLLQ